MSRRRWAKAMGGLLAAWEDRAEDRASQAAIQPLDGLAAGLLWVASNRGAGRRADIANEARGVRRLAGRAQLALPQFAGDHEVGQGSARRLDAAVHPPDLANQGAPFARGGGSLVESRLTAGGDHRLACRRLQPRLA